MKKFLGLAALGAAAILVIWLTSGTGAGPAPVGPEEADTAPEIEPVDDPHPFSIEALRARDYPGGQIVVERELGDLGAFYSYVVSYPSDGLKLSALMHVPDRPIPEGGFPVIVLNHGYIPPDVYSTLNSYRSYMDAYARQGFLVLKPDYRGHDGSQGEPAGAHISADYVVDVLNLVGSVDSIPQANPEKIGMWGHSMGGGITLRAIAISGRIQAAALLAGVVAPPHNFYDYWQQRLDDPSVPAWIKENARMTLEEFGEPGENPDLWDSISPYSYFSQLDIPIQIHHGTADSDVPIEFSQELHQALLAAGKDSEYFVYPGGDHNLAGAARAPVLSRTSDFFRSSLQ